MNKIFFILTISTVSTGLTAQNLSQYVQQTVNQNNRGNQSRGRGNMTNILVQGNVKQQQNRNVNVSNFYMNVNESNNINDVNNYEQQSDNVNVNKSQVNLPYRGNIQVQTNPPVRRNTNVTNPAPQIQNNVNPETNTNFVAQVQLVTNNDYSNTQQNPVASTGNFQVYTLDNNNAIDLNENVNRGNENDVILLNIGTDHQVELIEQQVQVKNVELPQINAEQSLKNPVALAMPEININIEKPVLDFSWMNVEKSQKKKATSVKRITGNKNYRQDKPAAIKNVLKKKGNKKEKNNKGKKKYECFKF